MRRNRSGSPWGIVLGAVFVAILLVAGLVTSQAAAKSGQPAHQQAYVENK